MIATFALLLLCQEPEAPGSAGDARVVDHAHVLAEARAALERAEAARGAGEQATARAEAELVVKLLGRLPDGELDQEAAELLWRVGLVAYRTGVAARAVEAWRRVCDYRERTLHEDHADLLLARQNLAAAMKTTGDLQGARELEEAVLEACERTLPEDHRDLLRARQNLAVSLSLAGELQDALALIRSVVSACQRTLPADHPRLLRARQVLVDVLMAMGDLDGAQELLEDVIAALERTLPEDHELAMWARATLGSVLQTRGDLAGALALLEEELRVRERTLPEDAPILLTARYNVASALAQLGDRQRSRELLESVVSGFERIHPPDHPNLARARGELASVLEELGDLERARVLQEQALASLERTRAADDRFLLAAQGNYALTLLRMGDFAGARALGEKVLAGFERSHPELHPLLIQARRSLASTLEAMGELEGARALSEAVLTAYEQTLPENHPDVVAARLGLATEQFRMGDAEEALALTRRAVRVIERTSPPGDPLLALGRQNLAHMLRGSEHGDEARALQATVLAELERTLPEGHPQLLRARHGQVTLLLEAGELEAARSQGRRLAEGMIAALDGVRSPREAREAVAAVAAHHPLMRLATSVGGAPSTRLRFQVAETMRAAANVPDYAWDETDPRRTRLARIREELSSRVWAGQPANGSSGSLASELADLALERDRLERELRGELAAHGIESGPIEASRVARALPERAAAVGFVRYERYELDESSSTVLPAGDSIAVYVLSSDDTLDEVDLGSADELEELARAWRTALGKSIERGLVVEEDGERERRTGNELRERLLDPVLELLDGETKRLHVGLDDFLHLLPLDALPLGQGRVGDRYELVNEASLARLLSSRASPVGGPSLLAMGGAHFDAEPGAADGLPYAAAAPVRADRASSRPESFAPLLQTRFEVETVGLLFGSAHGDGAVVLSGGSATKAALREHAPDKRYIHVATHGWFAPETLESTLDRQSVGRLWSPLGYQETVTGFAPGTLCGLAFAGANRGGDSLGRVPGILTAEELAGIDLAACELAVLSACETNVGIRRAGQGIQSLQAALYAAGAKSSITSLWKVDDAATRRLFELFYAHLWEDGLPKAEALWRAKRALRDEGAPVRDWGAWVLTGDPE